MENKDTEYIDGSGDDFLEFIFSSEPREINSVKLELDSPKDGIKIGLHIFQWKIPSFDLLYFLNNFSLFQKIRVHEVDEILCL